MTTITESHIRLDARGVAWIDDANVKVVEVAIDHLASGMSAEEIQLQHPHLSLAQVHAALAYYFDHQEAMDAEIERRSRRVDAMQRAARPPFTRKALLARLRRR